jgi:hypothetical protein
MPFQFNVYNELKGTVHGLFLISQAFLEHVPKNKLCFPNMPEVSRHFMQNLQTKRFTYFSVAFFDRYICFFHSLLFTVRLKLSKY